MKVFEKINQLTNAFDNRNNPYDQKIHLDTLDLENRFLSFGSKISLNNSVFNKKIVLIFDHKPIGNDGFPCRLEHLKCNITLTKDGFKSKIIGFKSKDTKKKWLNFFNSAFNDSLNREYKNKQ